MRQGAPRCPDCPHPPRTGSCRRLQAGKAKRQMGRAPQAATCPARGPGRGWSYSRRHALDSRQKPTEKLHTCSSGVSVRLRGKDLPHPLPVPGNQANIPGSHQEEWLVGPRRDRTPRPCRDTQEVLRSLPLRAVLVVS